MGDHAATTASPGSRRGRAGRASTRRRRVLAAVMVVVAVLWLLPAVWVLVTSLKRAENIIRMPPEWIPWPPTLAHYVEVLFSSSRTARIGRAFLNSAVVSLGSVVVVVITSAMAAYPWRACSSAAGTPSSRCSSAASWSRTP